MLLISAKNVISTSNSLIFNTKYPVSNLFLFDFIHCNWIELNLFNRIDHYWDKILSLWKTSNNEFLSCSNSAYRYDEWWGWSSETLMRSMASRIRIITTQYRISYSIMNQAIRCWLTFRFNILSPPFIFNAPDVCDGV